jgi:hypothetical protein
MTSASHRRTVICPNDHQRPRRHESASSGSRTTSPMLLPAPRRQLSCPRYQLRMCHKGPPSQIHAIELSGSSMRADSGDRQHGRTAVAKFCSNHAEPARSARVVVKRATQRQALSRPVGTCFANKRSVPHREDHPPARGIGVNPAKSDDGWRALAVASVAMPGFSI